MAGCSFAPPKPPVDSTPPVDRAGAVQQLLVEWMATTDRDDRAAFDETLATGDPSVAVRGAAWYANLRTFRGALQLTALTSEAVPGIGIRTRYQDRAWLQQVRASWRNPGSRSAEATLWLTLVAENGRALFAGDSATPAADRLAPRPLWLQTAVTFERRGAVTVVGVAGEDVEPWLTRADAAARAVRTRLPRWDGALTLEVPTTEASFERSIGVAAGSYATIGAVAWPRGGRSATAAVDVVVNPAVTSTLGAEGLAVLLTHETVHVATRSFASAAPTWLIEGYADQLAYAVRPAGRAAALRQLRAAGPPTRLPAEDDFDPGAADLDLAYARAWSLCDLIADRYGDAALNRLYETVGAGVSPAEGLRRLGTTEAGLLREWQARS